MAAGPITIAGLGPAGPELRTVALVDALAAARVVILRTGIHPGVDDLLADPRVRTCDDCYQAGASFDEVYARVADRVLAAAADGPVLYLTPGHPRYGERVTPLIEERAAAAGIAVAILPAVSALDVLMTALGVDLMTAEPASIDATTLAAILDDEPFAAGRFDLSPARATLVTQVYAPEMAAATKLALARRFPETHRVAVVRGAGLADGEVAWMPLHELDRAQVDHLTSVWVPALPALDALRHADGLLRITALLRAPDGCPWDRKQTHTSLVPALLEEAYEVADAIAGDDPAHLQEELGDLLLAVAMQSQIAEEAGDFTFEDVAEGIAAKLIRRHPHVFGDLQADDPEAVLGVWRAVKAQERAASGAPARPSHPIDRFPNAMPVVRRLVDVLSPAAPVTPVGDGGDHGDQLFDAVAAAVAAGFDPERLLADAARRRIPEDETDPNS